MNKCIKCGSYAFNLYKEDIDQGGLCDVHYWQGRAHRAEAKQEQQVVSLQCAHCQVTIDTLNDKVMSLLAKQEQGEPVAYPEGDVVGACICGSWPGGKCLKCPRITTPQPAQKPWVGLTDGDIDLLEELYAPPVHPDFVNDADHCLELIRHVEAKLKEKNSA
jgi:hypothetical protein